MCGFPIVQFENSLRLTTLASSLKEGAEAGNSLIKKIRTAVRAVRMD